MAVRSPQWLRSSLVPIGFFLLSAVASYAFVQRWNTQSRVLDDASSDSAGADQPSSVILLDPQYPCGPVCLSLVCGLLETPKSLDEVRALVKPDRLGRTSLAELVTACKSLQLSAAGARVDPLILTRLPIPVIIHTRENHFVVGMANPTGQVLILDPPRKPREVSGAALNELCSGNVILVARRHDELVAALTTGGIRGTVSFQ